MRAGSLREQPCCIPLLCDLGGAVESWLVGAGIKVGQYCFFGDLVDQGGLSNLSGPGDDLNELAWLSQPLEQQLGLRTRV